MRTIKFRAKAIENYGNGIKKGDWVYGDLLQENYHEHNYILHYNKYYRDSRTKMSTPIDNKTVGQYTGLKDINGIEIYEGDILIIDHTLGDELYNDVGFKDGCFGYMTETGEFLPFCDNRVTEEIAGNIHDNPELLKKQ